MRIREFRPEDYETVYDLWKRGQLDLALSDNREEVLKMHDTHPDLFLVGEENGRIMAVVMGGFDGRRGIIHHLVVDSEYRHKGYGQQIIEELERRLNALGVVKVNFWVQTNNLQAVGFYEKVGYYLRPDLVTMSKVLREK